MCETEVQEDEHARTDTNCVDTHLMFLHKLQCFVRPVDLSHGMGWADPQSDGVGEALGR